MQTIINDIKLGPRAPLMPVSATSKKIFHSLVSKDFHNSFHYRSVAVMLNYLAGLTRPDIKCALHAFAKITSNFKQEHGEAIYCVAR